MWVRRETRSGNGLAPLQVFHAVPSSPFSAPAELACPIIAQQWRSLPAVGISLRPV